MCLNSSNKSLLKSLERVFNKYSVTTLASRMLVLDLALLDLEQNMANDYTAQHKLYPGYSKYFSTIALLNCKYYDGGPSSVDDKDVAFLNSVLDKISRNNLKQNGADAVGAIFLAQRDWQKKYIFKTYLFSLLLENKKLQSLYNQLGMVNSDDMISLCLLPKFSSSKEFLAWLVRINKMPHVLFDNILRYVINNMRHISIDYYEYKNKQTEKIEKANYDIFSSRAILKDYPLIHFENNFYAFSSYFYLQDALISRTIREMAGKGNNTKVIGDAFEEVMFESFSRMYTHCDCDQHQEKIILLNPKTKKSGELCDILIKKDGKYILIDCKAKEMIEEVFQKDSSELNVLKEKFEQRINRIKDIEEGKFTKYFPQTVNKDDIFSIVALMDDGTYFKKSLFSQCFNDLSPEEKEFYNKHIHIISFDDLLEIIVANVDLFQVIQESINNGEYGNHLALNVRTDHKNEYSEIFNNWYDNSIEKMQQFIFDKKILEEDD